jgi:hypothetical protein
VRHWLPIAIVAALASCGGSEAPEWLQVAAKVEMEQYFGEIEPERVDYILGSRRHRVIYDFGRPVNCFGCSRPRFARAWVQRSRYAEVIFDVASRELRVFSVNRRRDRLYGERNG